MNKRGNMLIEKLSGFVGAMIINEKKKAMYSALLVTILILFRSH